MPTKRIAPADWPGFFDTFSREHYGKRASAQLHGPGLYGGNTEVRALALMGLACEKKGSDSRAVRVMLGGCVDDHLTHEVPAPTGVWHRAPGQDGCEMLEIHGADGQTLILKVRR